MRSMIFTLCKPCSVLLTKWQPFISAVAAFTPFNSFVKILLPNFGFLACGVYLVPLLMFPLRLRHCDTLRESAIDNVLRLFLRRHQSVPGLINWTSTNTTTISDRASMDFPLENTSGCLTYVIAC